MKGSFFLVGLIWFVLTLYGANAQPVTPGSSSQCSNSVDTGVPGGGISGTCSAGPPLNLQTPAIMTYQAQATPSSWAAFVTFLGRQPAYALDYTSNGSTCSWSCWVGSVNSIAGAYGVNGSVPGQYRLVLSVAPVTAGATLAQVAAGNFDTYLAQAAQILIAQGLGNTIIRWGWEFNGGFDNWTPNGRPGFSATDWNNAWIHAWTVFAAQPGANFQWFWCTNSGYGALAPPTAYPGDAYVDYIGTDAYWVSYNANNLTQAQVWENDYLGYDTIYRPDAAQYAVQWAADFAAEHGKQFAIGELGVGYEPSAYGSGDSSYFWDQLIPFMQANNGAFIGIWTLGLSSGYQGTPWFASNYTGVPPAGGLAFDVVHSAWGMRHYFGTPALGNLSTSEYETAGPSGLSFAVAPGYSDGAGGIYIPTGTAVGTVLGQLSVTGSRIFFRAEQAGEGGTDRLVAVNQFTGQLTLAKTVSFENLDPAIFSARNAVNGELITINVTGAGVAPQMVASETLNANYQPANGTLLWTDTITNTPSPAPTCAPTGTNAAYFTAVYDATTGGCDISTNNQAALVNGTYTLNAVATNPAGSATTAITVVVHASGQTAPSNNQSAPAVTGPASPLANFLASSNVYTGTQWSSIGLTGVSPNTMKTDQTYSAHSFTQNSQYPLVSGNVYQLETIFAAGGGLGPPQEFGLSMDSSLFSGAPSANFAFSPSLVVQTFGSGGMNALENWTTGCSGCSLARITATATGSGTAASSLYENESFIPPGTSWTATANLQVYLTNGGITDVGLYGAGYQNSTQGVWIGTCFDCTYQWQTAPDDVTWSNLAGATAATYPVQSTDIGSYIRSTVTSTGTDSTTAVAASPGVQIVPFAPMFETLPTFTGTLAVGQVVTAVDGTMREAPTGTDTYQWNRAGTLIAGATSSTYTIQTADTSTLLSVTITRTNTGGSATATSLGVGIPPTISAISSGTPGASTATITWTTNEAASSRVNYGLTTSYGSNVSSGTLVTSHSLGLTGLTGGTTYHFNVVSTDANGYTATSGDNTFTTTYQGVGDIQAMTSWWGFLPYNAANASAGPTTIPVADVYGVTTATYCTIFLKGDGSINTDNTTTGAGGVGNQCLLDWVQFCTVTNASCNVSKIYDQAGSNPIFTTTVGDMLTLVLNCYGSNPCGQSQETTASQLVCTNNVTPATGKVFFTLVANRSIGTTAELIIAENGTQNYVLGAGANTWELAGSAGNITKTANDATWHSAQGVINTTSSALYIDNATVASGSVTGGTTVQKCSAIRGASTMAMEFFSGGFADNVTPSSGTISSLIANEQAVLP
jgi:hypothetical protein